MIQRGKPWEHFREDIIEATQYMCFAEAFNWDDKKVDALDPDKRLMYLALMKGSELGSKEDK